MDKRKLKLVLSVIMTFVMSISLSSSAYAVVTIPEKMIYEGRLLNSAGDAPLSGSHDFRFSFWNTSPVVAGDVSGGVIDTLSPNYSGWQEVQTVTPNLDGFFSFELGSVSPIPKIDSTQHLYLQVEIKASGDPDTSYEILDRAPSDPTSDRSPIGSVPYAMNADYIDNAELGTSTGDIVVLDAGDVWPTSTIPGGTNGDTFIIDSNDDAVGSIDLQFGSALGSVLSWDLINGYFNFNNSVNVEGDITLTGTVDGVDISDLALQVSQIDTNIFLSPQYPHTTYFADGSDNVGRLSYDFDDVNFENYYRWETSKLTLQDYDVKVRVKLPDNFTDWDATTPVQFKYRTNTGNSLDNAIDFEILDTTNTSVTSVVGLTSSTAGDWENSTSIAIGAGTFNPGEWITISIKLSATKTNYADIGTLVLNYI